MPAMMGENCHNDRGGDREMKGSEKTSIQGGAGERCGVEGSKEGQAKNKEKAQERKMKENRKPEKERGRVAVSRMSFTRVCPVL